MPQFLYSQCKRKDSTTYTYRGAQGNVEWHENSQPSTILANPCVLMVSLLRRAGGEHKARILLGFVVAPPVLEDRVREGWAWLGMEMTR